MGNELGTWVMHGVDWDDPECIHTKLVDFTQIKTIL